MPLTPLKDGGYEEWNKVYTLYDSGEGTRYRVSWSEFWKYSQFREVFPSINNAPIPAKKVE